MINKLFGRFRRSVRGASGTEYGMILALIAVVCIGTVTVLGGRVETVYEAVTDGAVTEARAEAIVAGHQDELRAIEFLDINDASLVTPYTSTIAVLTAGPLNISLVGGNATASLVRNGEILGVRSAVYQRGDLLAIYMESPGEPEATDTVVVDILGASPVGEWSITTAPDITPEPFSFTDVAGVSPSQLTTSNEVTLEAFSGSKSVSATGATGVDLIVDGVATGGPAAAVTAGQKLKLSMPAATEYETGKTAVVTLGDYTTLWTVATGPDIDPDVFTFAPQVDVVPSAVVISEEAIITGFSGVKEAAVSGIDGATLIVDGVDTGEATADIGINTAVAVKMTAADTYETTLTATVTLGSGSADFAVTTEADLDPDEFAFADADGVDPETVVYSNEVTLTGFSGTKTASLAGDPGFSLVIDGVDRGASYDVTAGAKLKLKVTSSAEAGGELSTSVTLGNYSAAWSVATSEGGVEIFISSNTSSYNLRSDLEDNYGWNGSSPINVEVTIMPGVVIGSSSTSSAAFSTGSFPSGSSITLINQGRIQGAGGKGGNGHSSTSLAYPGDPGGAALYLSTAVSIDNSTGEIWGGGGGGAGSAYFMFGAAGGGGGAGFVPGPGGTGYKPGSSGTTEAGGVGGTITATLYGGRGGAPGEAGEYGLFFGTPKGTGGAAGAAIVSNNHDINWLGGGNSPRVKGPIQ